MELLGGPTAGGIPVNIGVRGPKLSLSRSGNNLTISWAPSGGVLESTDSLVKPAVWIAVPNTVGNSVTVDLSTGVKFYRVRK